ncbi:hypothetical protein B0H63DRAFT_488847 [Podospora didyma]|uniref:Uncharacterized protein n=1 Tax=Podospora didyma TaxID=330526 RepID=A0AAE0N2M2_9PEZI|nr:hypothetical protein B0H63DRAFT_488847 [Podospora didyma]
MTLDGLGKYPPAKKELEVGAQLRLKLSDQADASQEDLLVFDVALRMNRTVTSFAVAAKITSTQSIANPFSRGMFNVQLEGRKIKGSSTKFDNGEVKRECTIYGTALLGSGSEDKARLLGLIHFERGKPVVGVEFTRRIVEALSSDQSLVPTETQIGTVKMNGHSLGPLVTESRR